MLRGAAAIAGAKRARQGRAFGARWEPFGAILQKKSARHRRALGTLREPFGRVLGAGRQPAGRTHVCTYIVPLSGIRVLSYKVGPSPPYNAKIGTAGEGLNIGAGATRG